MHFRQVKLVNTNSKKRMLMIPTYKSCGLVESTIGLNVYRQRGSFMGKYFKVDYCKMKEASACEAKDFEKNRSLKSTGWRVKYRQLAD